MIFLANENFPFPSIQILRDTGFNVESIGEKYSGISDEKNYSNCSTEQFNNSDF